jgi:hypothetical protein
MRDGPLAAAVVVAVHHSSSKRAAAETVTHLMRMRLGWDAQSRSELSRPLPVPTDHLLLLNAAAANAVS